MSIILTEAGWMRTAYKLAKRFGGKIVTAGRSKHPKIVGLDASGKQIKMTIPSSPSDNARTAKNVEAQLRRAGFVDRSKAAKVKDALVKGSKETVLKPTVKTPPASRQTTFKDFTQKFQPNVQGPKKSELQVQADNIIRSLQSSKRASEPVRRRISRAQLDAMDIPQKQKDALIRQGLVENKFRYAAHLMKKAGITNYDDLVRTVSDIKRGAAERIIKQLQTKPIPTQRGLELQRRMGRAYDKNKDLHPRLFEGVPTREVFHTEALTPEEKKNLKLKYQYDQRNNPKPIKPLDVLKSKKGMA